MAISKSVGNLIGGVSQQPENLRYENTAEESINTYLDVVGGLNKRRPTEHLGHICDDSTQNGYFHAIKRSPTEQYGIWVYRNTDGEVDIKAFNLLTGAAVKVVGEDLAVINSGATDGAVWKYLNPTGQKVDFDDGFQPMTIADTTFLLNRNRTVATSTAPKDNFEDCAASIQIAQGVARGSYRITIDGTEFFYTTRSSSTSGDADEFKTKYIANRLMYGGYNEHMGSGELESDWSRESATSDYDDDGSDDLTDPITQVMRGNADDKQKRALGLIQSGFCTHFIHTYSSSRTGDHDEYADPAAATDASNRKRKWRLYGDKTKWTDGKYDHDSDGSTATVPNKTKFKLGVEYYNSSDAAWKVVETDYIDFGTGLTHTAIATDIQTKLQALTGGIVVGSSLAGLTCASVYQAPGHASHKWWDYEISADFSGSSDTLIRDIFVTDVDYVVPTGKTNYTARVNHSSLAVMKWTGGITTASGALSGTSDSEQFAGHGMSIEVEDDGGGSYINVAHKTSVTFEDLPNVALDGQVVKVQGSLDEAADDYYLKFEAELDSDEDYRNAGHCWGQHFTKGIWVESTKEVHKETLDNSTMPHVLESRISSAVAGTDPDTSVVADGDPYFLFKPYSWSGRTVGDSDTNKSPSFVGSTISGLTYYRGRLGLLSGQSLSLSEAAGPGNFYKTTVTLLRDTDRVDITGRSPKVSIFKSAVEVNKNLILFSDQNQFMLTTGGGLLSPATAGLERVSSYEASPDIEPEAAGFSAYAPFSRDGYSGVNRFYPAGGANDLYKAEDITVQVPKYIKNKVRAMAISEQEGFLAVLTDDQDTLYCYKWLDSGDKRVQAAWFKMEFGPTTVEYSGTTYGTLRGIQIIDSTLYLIMNRAAQSIPTKDIYLEKVELEQGALDIAATATTSDVWYVTRLDRRVKSEDTSMSEAGGNTTITLPTGVDYKVGTTLELAYRHGDSGQVGGFRQTATVTGSAGSYVRQVVFSGDHTSKKFYIGIPYTMTHTMSPPYFQSGQGGALITGRVQVRRAWLDIADAGYVKTSVTPTGRSASVDYFPGANHGVAATSEVTAMEKSVPVQISSRNNEYVFDLINDSPYPARVVSVEFEATFNSRSRRFG